MSSIQDMVDVNTIIGEPIETGNNVVIIPVSKVTFGFAAGGSEFNGESLDEYKKSNSEELAQYRLPFGGGSAAGVNINPVAFIVVQDGCVKLMPVNHVSTIDKLIDYVPDLMEKINKILNKHLDNKGETYEKKEKTIEDENTKKHVVETKEHKIKPEKIKKTSFTGKSIPYKEDKTYELEYDEENIPEGDTFSLEEEKEDTEYDDEI
jgi:sporulation protein YtfJ